MILIQSYSRAESNPKLLEFEGFEGVFKIEAGEIYTGSKIPEKLKVEDVYQEILSLKDSNKEEDQIQFINQLKLLTEVEELELSSNFAEDYLISKIQDRQVSFKVRKKALYTLVNWGKVRKQNALDWVTNHFSENEQTALVGEISNWVDSDEKYKQDFIYDFVYRFLTEHIEQNVQFSFQSIVFNMLNKNEDLEKYVILIAGENKNAKVIGHLLKDKTIEQLREFSYSVLKDITSVYMNQNRVRSLRGEDLEFFFLYLTEKQKSWVAPEQFETVSFQRLDGGQKDVFAQYIVEYLNQSEVENLEPFIFNILNKNKDFEEYVILIAVKNKNVKVIDYLLKDKTIEQLREFSHTSLGDIMPFYMNQNRVQSLRGEDLEFVFLYLEKEQESWVTPEQFKTVSFQRLNGDRKDVFAEYIAEYLNQSEVYSLDSWVLEVYFPLLKDKQKEWVDMEKFNKLAEDKRQELASDLSRSIVQSLQGEDLEFFFLYFTPRQENWVKPEQFKTVSFQRLDGDRKDIFAQYIAEYLNQSEVYSLDSWVLEVYFPLLKDKQKEWVDMEKFNKLAEDKRQELASYLGRSIVQSLQGKDLEFFFLYLTEKQKNWVTPEQFETVSLQRLNGDRKDVFAEYIAEYLNQDEIESLEESDLEFFLPYLTSEQINWITLEQFKTLPSLGKEYDSVVRDLIRRLAPKLNQEEVQSLKEEDLKVFLPRLTKEQKDWVTLRQFSAVPNYERRELAEYFNKSIIQSLKGEDLKIFLPRLTKEQKNWITLRQFSAMPSYERRELAEYFNKSIVQSWKGEEDLDRLLPHLKDEQTDWITLEQFKTLPSIGKEYDPVVRDLIRKLAPKLNQEEVQNLEEEDLKVFLPHLTNEQKDWVTLRQFSTLPRYVRRKLAEYFNKSIVQSLKGEALDRLLPYLKDEQTDWITLEQFKTLPSIGKEYDPVVRDLIRKLAPNLNQEEVQNLEGEDLEVFLPHLIKEQKDWVTLRQFSAMPRYVRRELAEYFNKSIVQSLEREDLRILLPHLTSEQINWIDVEKRRIGYNLQKDFADVY